MQLVLAFALACVTDVPEPRPPTSDELIERLPDTPPPAPAPVPTSAPGGGPVDVTLHQVRGTPVGTRVRVSGFLVEADPDETLISADSEGKTLLLRCAGQPLPDPVPRGTPVEVTGTTADPAGETIVLSDCAAVATGDAPRDP